MRFRLARLPLTQTLRPSLLPISARSIRTMQTDPAPALAPVAPSAVPAASTSAPADVSAPAPAGSAVAENGASTSTAQQKKPGPKVNPSGKGKRKRNRRPLPDPYSPADVLYHDVVDFLGPDYVKEVLARGDESEWTAPAGLERFSVVELNVGAMTVSGELPLGCDYLRSARARPQLFEIILS